VAATQVSCGETAMAGQRRGGERRLGVCGVTMSLGRGRCGDRRARRWLSMGRWPRQPKEAASSVLRRFLTADNGSAANSRGSEAHESGAGWSALGGEERGDERAEADGESRAEWAVFGGYRGKRRDGFSHGPTGGRGDPRGGGCMRRAWSRRGGRPIVSARSGGSGHAAVTRARRQHPSAG
jgi:hypothetical protein